MFLKRKKIKEEEKKRRKLYFKLKKRKRISKKVVENEKKPKEERNLNIKLSNYIFIKFCKCLNTIIHNSRNFPLPVHINK